MSFVWYFFLRSSHRLWESKKWESLWIFFILYISQVRSIVCMVESPYVLQMNCTQMEILISGSCMRMYKHTNIELMSRSSQAPSSHLHMHLTFRIFLLFCVPVCFNTSKRHDILLWMTNTLKFTYIFQMQTEIHFLTFLQSSQPFSREGCTCTLAIFRSFFSRYEI